MAAANKRPEEDVEDDNPEEEQIADNEPIEEESDEEDDNEYILGFVEEAEAINLLRHQFPSKIGGRPAWLDPLHLPSQQQLTCEKTNKTMNFLLQLYAPLDDDVAHDEAFHRSMFLFVTPQGKHLGKPGTVKAFRCQLPRSNAFYSHEPPSKTDVVPQALQASDREASIAGDPWKVIPTEEAHAEAAAAAKKSKKSKAASSAQPSSSSSSSPPAVASGLVLFPENELVVEPEERETEEEQQEMMDKLIRDYQAKVATEGELDEQELPPEVLDQLEGQESRERRHFAMFQARMELAPEQVVRYCFRQGARPQWPSTSNIPKPEDIPACPHCKQPRRFEFQVMPQLLNHLDQDELDDSALDWSTLAVYSCPASCQAGVSDTLQQHNSAYVEEYVWVQPAA